MTPQEGADCSDAETLKGLLERVQAAAGPDRELDFDLARWRGWTEHDDKDDPVFTGKVSTWWAEPGCEWSTTSVPPCVTGSVDAALALVEQVLPGWDLELETIALGKLGKGYATLRGPNFSDADMSQYVQTDGLPKPAPLAILDALLQASRIKPTT